MFKISELNPKDNTLDKIHAIQKRIYEEDKDLSTKELIKKYKRIRKEFAKNYNVNFNVTALKESLH